MRQTILSNWNFIRFLRLGLGIAITVQSLIEGNWTLAVLGLAFTAMPVFNIGCCSTTGCATPVKRSANTIKDISYEEVV